MVRKEGSTKVASAKGIKVLEALAKLLKTPEFKALMRAVKAR